MFSFFHRKDKAVRIFLGALLVMVCLTMIGYLIPGFTSLGPSTETVLAKVGSERITGAEMGRELRVLTRDSRVPANMIPLYAPTLLDQLITEQAQLVEARRMGLRVSPEEVAAVLRSNPGLYPNGQFIGYDQYRQIIEQRYGMSVPEFEQKFERSLLTEKLRRLITAGVAINDADLLREFHRRNDKVKIGYVTLKTPDVRDKLTITDAELNDYFQKHQAQYEIPEQREFRVVFADTSRLKDSVPVSDQDLRGFYNQNRDRFRVEARAKVSHILFKTMGKTPAETEEIRKKAEDVLQKVQKGAVFAEMAKQYSDDAATTPKGGDLGWVVRGQTVPEFEKTAFSLEPGKLSGVIQTQYGFHILKVESRERAHQQSFEEVKEQILPEVKAAKAQRAAEDETRKIDDAVRKSKGKLQALASSLGLAVTGTGLLKRGDPLPGAGSTPALDDALFSASLKAGQVTDAVQLANGVVVAELVKISPTHPAELAEVRDRVENDVRNQKAAQTVDTRIKQVADLARKEGLAKAAASQNLKVQSAEPFTADGNIKDLGFAGSLTEAFRLKSGDIGGPNVITDGQVVYQVTAREEAPDSQFAATKDSIRDQLQQQKAMEVYQVFLGSLRKRMEKEGKLSVNEAALQRLVASFQQ